MANDLIQGLYDYYNQMVDSYSSAEHKDIRRDCLAAMSAISGCINIVSSFTEVPEEVTLH